ncbi:MAG: DUF2207 domain-containing protein [Christensenellales bacterium]|jgi:uncharacterized membrane protein YgcG
MKRIIAFLAAAIIAVGLLMFPAPAFAQDSSYRYFKDYNVHIKVSQNNVLDIVEEITSDYTLVRGPAHGIIRSIPTALSFTAEDIEKMYRLNVSNISVPSFMSSVSRESNYVHIRIGDPNEYVTGIVTYTINYTLNLGDDDISDFDMFYFNVIGTGWDAETDKASFTIEMPKEFDAAKVWAYKGRYGSGEQIDLNISGNVISGEAFGLRAQEGVTVQVDLPEGYFTGERLYRPFEPWLIAACVIVTVVAAALLLRYGRDKKLIAPVEFYPPEGMTPAEVGYVIDGRADNKDVVSLIIYWADKGYLRIVEEKKNKITLEKIKDMPEEAKFYEKNMFEALFKSGDAVAIKTLETKFYTTVEMVKAGVKDVYSREGNRLYTLKSQSISAFARALAALTLAVSTFIMAWYHSGEPVWGVICAALSMLVMLPLTLMTNIIRDWAVERVAKRVGRLILALIFSALALALYVIIMVAGFDLPLVAVATAVAALVASLAAGSLRRRTQRGTELIGHLLGLRQFIEMAEKDRIERLVEQDPSYFYSILPYAYVLGITDKWAKNFERIGIDPGAPNWYSGYRGTDVFSTVLFINMMNSTMNSMSTSFTSRPAPQGGVGGGGSGFGGGGGGGFSGGGFGGGGGRGW